MMERTVYYCYASSPIGRLLLTAERGALTGLFMEPHRHAASPGEDCEENPDAAPLAAARRQLAAFFAGERRDFDLPLAPRGTEFQQRVWQGLQEIPFGATISYGELARRIGNAAACRAVGLANGRNPISIIIPCHRVIGANGTPTGYGGGLSRKVALLNFEAAVLASGPYPMPHCG